MNIIYLSYSDINGGAAKGAYRLHKGFSDTNINSKMLVRRKSSDDSSVEQYNIPLSKRKEKFNDCVAQKLYPIFREKLQEFSSFNLRYTNVDKYINNSDADVVIMHWIGADTISLKEISKIKKPIIWRLADMWAVDGAYHYNDSYDLSFEYEKPQQIYDDINAWVWNRKKRYFANQKFTIVCGSNWLADKVKQSPFFKSAEVLAIASGIDIDKFKPYSRIKSKAKFGIDKNKKVILFGADTGLNDIRKGYDLLLDALELLYHEIDYTNIRLLMFGTPEKYKDIIKGFEAEAVGYVKDEHELASLYSAADVMVVPSRMDNLPFTAIESISCGTPVVGFNIGGVPEIVEHKKTGYIAKPFDVNDLKNGIKWVLETQNYEELIANSRNKAVDEFDVNLQTQKYIDLIKKVSK